MPRFPLASLVIALFLFAAVFDIVSGLEHWPFGSYPMYSLTYSKRLDSLRLYGVNGSAEVPLDEDRDFAPFDQARLVAALSRVPARDLPDALRNLLHLHNTHSAPAQALRLYSVSWNLRPGMGRDQPPDRRALLAEASGNGR